MRNPQSLDVLKRLSASQSTRPLTAREIEILDLAAHGLTNPQIAERLHLSPFTVHNHFGRIREALDAGSRCHAVGIGYQRGILALTVSRPSLSGGADRG